MVRIFLAVDVPDPVMRGELSPEDVARFAVPALREACAEAVADYRARNNGNAEHA